MKTSVNKLVEKVSESCEEGCQLDNHPTPDHYPGDGDHDNVDHDDDDDNLDDVGDVDDVHDDDNDAFCKCCICILSVSICLVIL